MEKFLKKIMINSEKNLWNLINYPVKNFFKLNVQFHKFRFE